MSNNGDYGYFGTGSSGYAHYMQSFNETTSSNNYSRPKNTTSSNQDDCAELLLTIIFAPITIPLFIIAEFLRFLLD